MSTHRIQSKVVCQIPNKVRPGRIGADFSGGEINCDSGVVLTSAIAEHLNLFGRVADCFDDRRNFNRKRHHLTGLFRKWLTLDVNPPGSAENIDLQVGL